MKLFSQAYLLYLLLCPIGFCVVSEVFVRIRTQRAEGLPRGALSEMYKTDEETGLRIPISNLEVKGAQTHVKINSPGFRGNALETEKFPQYALLHSALPRRLALKSRIMTVFGLNWWCETEPIICA